MFLSQPFPVHEPYTHACCESITQLELPKIQQFCKTINTLSAGIAHHKSIAQDQVSIKHIMASLKRKILKIDQFLYTGQNFLNTSEEIMVLLRQEQLEHKKVTKGS